MTESTEDKDVDTLITEMQATLDKLKAAQTKDVKDESGEEDAETPRDQQPKTLQEARIKVKEHYRSRRAAQASSQG